MIHHQRNDFFTSMPPTACYYCGQAIDSAPFLEWMGEPSMYLHPSCGLAFSCRLVQDVTEILSIYGELGLDYMRWQRSPLDKKGSAG